VDNRYFRQTDKQTCTQVMLYLSNANTLDFPFLMFYRTHVIHLCSDCNRRTENS